MDLDYLVADEFQGYLNYVPTPPLQGSAQCNGETAILVDKVKENMADPRLADVSGDARSAIFLVEGYGQPIEMPDSEDEEGLVDMDGDLSDADSDCALEEVISTDFGDSRGIYYRNEDKHNINGILRMVNDYVKHGRQTLDPDLESLRDSFCPRSKKYKVFNHVVPDAWQEKLSSSRAMVAPTCGAYQKYAEAEPELPEDVQELRKSKQLYNDLIKLRITRYGQTEANAWRIDGTAERDRKQAQAAPTPQLHSPYMGKEPPVVSRSQKIIDYTEAKGLNPIIILPNSCESIINMVNAEDFLNHGKIGPAYLSHWLSKPKEIRIKKSFGSKEIEFRVIDDINGLRPSEWRSVVGIVVSGQEWQFRDWPFATHRDLFSSMKAFFFRFSHTDIPESVRKWGVETFELRSGSGGDHQYLVVTQFWNQVSLFLNSNSEGRKFSNDHVLP